MSEIQNNNKIATVGYLSKVLTPIVTLVKNVKTEVMNIFSLPKGGTAGQVLAKTSNVDGEAEWVDIAASGTLDDAPTQGSENAVKSGGVYAALLDKQDTLVGTAGQVVGFDADGNAVAQDAAATVLPVGVEGQYIGYDVDGNPVAMDVPVDHLTREVVDVLPDPTAAEENVIYIYKNADPVTAVVAYEEYQLVDGALVRMSGEPVDLSGYQAKLTGVETQYVGFDADGKAIAVDLPEGHLTREVVDVLPAADVAFEDVVYVLRVPDATDPAVTKYQHWALIDGEMVMIGGEDIELPTDHLAYEIVDALPDAGDAVEGKLYILRVVDALGATTYQEYKLLDGAMVMSSADLSNVQTKLTGLENQYVGFDVNGDAVAIDLPTDHLVREVVDALPAIDDAKETVVYILKVVDPGDASVTYEQWQLIEGAFAQVGGAPVELPENHLTREIVDTLPDPADALETVLYVLKTEDVAAGTVTYSEWQLIDGAMVQVSSVDLSGYQTKLTGTTGQMIVIDANGDAVAQDFPEGMLTREVVDVLPDVADAKENVTYILKKDDGAGNITYSEWQLIDGELVQVGGEVTDMSAYQLKLTGLETQYVGFDALGKAVAIDLPVDHLTREVVDALPAVDAAAETVIYVLKVTDADSGNVTGYQEWVLVDGAFVQTSGAAVDLSGYQEKLTGLETQYVGFDANGDAVALDMPTGHLTREVVTALPEVGAASEEVVYILKTEDIDAGTATYEEYILVDGAFVKTSNEATDLSDYQKKIVGTDGQHVVFNAAGELVAADMPEGHLTREVVDVLPGVDDAAEDVIYILKVTDPGTAAVAYEEWVLVEGAFVKTSNEAVDLSGKQDLLVGTETQFVGFDAGGKAIAKDISEIVDEAKTYTDEQINLAAHLKREIVTADPTTLVDTNEHTIYMYKVNGAAGADVYQEWMLIDGTMTLIGDTSTTIDLSGKQDTLVGADGQLVGFDAAGAAIAVTPDVVPTEDSALPITSGAVYNALANLDVLPAGTEGQVVGYDVNGDPVAMDLPTSGMKVEVVDVLPDAGVAEADVMYVLKTTDAGSGAVHYEQYQLIDGAVVLVGHELPDMSGYQEKLVGTAGQVVGFDENGEPVAQDMATAALPVGTEGQVIGYDEDGNVVAMDLPSNADQMDHIELNEQGTLTDSGGYIDFHHPDDLDADYTSRIIEQAKGILTISNGINTQTLNATNKITVNNRPVYYSINTTCAALGITSKSTVDPATFLSTLYKKYGNTALVRLEWTYDAAAYVSDGTTTAHLAGGILLFAVKGDPDTSTWNDMEALYIGPDGKVFLIYAYNESNAGVWTRQRVLNITFSDGTTSGTYNMIIPTSQPTSLQAGAIWLTT